jgi:hypothetical protein
VLPAVDAAVYVDTAERVHGPPDRTASLLEAIFDKEIASGKLTIVRLGYVASQAEYPNALARNTALQVLQSKQVDSFMALDADDMLRTDVCAAGMVQISKLLEDGCAAMSPFLCIPCTLLITLFSRPSTVPTPIVTISPGGASNGRSILWEGVGRTRT